MKKKLSIIILLLLTITSKDLLAQKLQIKRDTIYYLVDTIKVPKADRMFLYGEEGDTYGYRLTCQCNTWQSDAFFVRRIDAKGLFLKKADFKKYKFITIRELIAIVVKFGNDNIRNHDFYFAEQQEKKFLLYRVYLAHAIRPSVSNDYISFPPDTNKIKKP